VGLAAGGDGGGAHEAEGGAGGGDQKERGTVDGVGEGGAGAGLVGVGGERAEGAGEGTQAGGVKRPSVYTRSSNCACVRSCC